MSQVLTAPIPAVTAGTDFTFDVGVVPSDVEEYQLGQISVVGPTAITAQGGTAFNTITLQQYRAGVKVRDLAAWNAGTTALVADTALNLNPATEHASEFQAGDVIRGAVTHTGAGANQVASVVNVELV